MLILGGYSFVMDKKPFTKQALTFEEQAKLLITRKLDSESLDVLIKSLAHYNYYRLSGYCLAFEVERHKFYPKVSFSALTQTYEFDRKLRKIVFEGLELIEIQLRTSVAYLLGTKYGPFSHEKLENLYFKNLDEYAQWILSIHKAANNSKEIFTRHFQNTYQEFPSLPIWVLVEILSFGALSHLFSYLKNEDKITIADSFGVNPALFGTWLHSFSVLRNICAHHSRLFDRTLSVSPKYIHRGDYVKFPNNRIIYSLITIRTILRAKCFSEKSVTSWKTEIENLFRLPPPVPKFYEKVGAPLDQEKWLNDILWK